MSAARYMHDVHACWRHACHSSRTKNEKKRSGITTDPGGHRPQRAGANMFKTGAGAVSSVGADTEPNRRQSNREYDTLYWCWLSWTGPCE